VASVGTDPIPAGQPEPETARQAGDDRPAVWAVGLAKSYGSTVALAGLDLHVAAGETVALLGPNGAGKSTTIGLLLGLLHPDRGQVQVHDRSPSRAVADGLVGAMLQDTGLMPGVRVGELLAMARGLYPRPLPLDDLVAAADLGSLLGRRADRLSGGQAQRVRFAAAIDTTPTSRVRATRSPGCLEGTMTR
jgi:ABC-2 type transport system ATP-binding protein